MRVCLWAHARARVYICVCRLCTRASASVCSLVCAFVLSFKRGKIKNGIILRMCLISTTVTGVKFILNEEDINDSFCNRSRSLSSDQTLINVREASPSRLLGASM